MIRDSELVFHVRVVHAFVSVFMCVLRDAFAILPGVHEVVLTSIAPPPPPRQE